MVEGQDEIPLPGRVTNGVVRVGDTVRRPPTANSDFVRRLLRHLAIRGFEGIPAPLGTDEQGRDVFAFIEGEVPVDLAFHNDETLCRAAELIRRFHDLSAELVVAAAADGGGMEVVCHNDLSPCNFVFRTGAPVAIIDFDAAAPGTRVHDLGYAAWLWLDLGSPEIAASDQRRRLAVFLDAYGMRNFAGVLAEVLVRQATLVAQGQHLRNFAMARWAADCMDWTQRNDHVLRGR
jgi:aminoglycoside phosphotransferase (APT) family kinase protein